MKSLWGNKARRWQGKVGRFVLAALLAFMVVPALPLVSPNQKAEAFEGTTNYSGFFNIVNYMGEAGSISGQTLTSASTYSSSDYEFSGIWQSCAIFVSKKPVSLLGSWEVSFKGSSNPLWYMTRSDHRMVNTGFHPGLTSTPTVSGGTTYVWDYVASRTGSGSETCDLRLRHVESGTLSNHVAVTWHQSPRVRFSYNAKNDTGTLSVDDTYQLSVPNVRATYGNSAYLLLGGYITWQNVNLSGGANAPTRALLTSTFESMELSNLTPQIYDISLYRADGTLIDKENDYVQPGDKVQVRCTVRNSNSASVSGSFNEQYPMHLKLANTAAHPTSGLTPFADSSHPVQVNGSTVATSKNDNTITGANGVPITLVGTQPVTVSWWAEVSGSEGGSVTLSQELIEDSFQGRQYSTVELVDEKPLEPAPDGVDPADPSSGAGTAWHYTRLPAANENGWNTTPVALRFYPGDYDSMDLTPSGQSSVTLSGASPEWKQSTDTEGVSLSGQARNSSTGAISTQRAGKVKIDSTAPSLEYRETVAPAGGQLVSDDSGEVSSGIWKLCRVGANSAATASAASASEENVFREFDLEGTDGDKKGAVAQTVTGVPNGYYVAVDAAGNRSAPVRVGSTPPPSVERPDPGAPDTPDPAGPPPGGDVPDPTVTPDDDGLLHGVIEETVTEIIDPDAPSFGGSLDLTDAQAIVAYRYALSSHAGGDLTVTTELLNAAGTAPIDALPTDVPGECLIRTKAVDSQGNTTTINLHYRFANDNCPVVRPWEPKDPADPDSPRHPGGPLTPDGPAKPQPDGTQRVTVSCEATEATAAGTMDAAGAVALLGRHFDITALDGSPTTVTAKSMEKAAGGVVSSIDLSRPADYRIIYEATDAEGNVTEVRLTYHLIAAKIPGASVNPGQPGGGDPFDPSNPSLPTEPPEGDDPRPLVPTEPVQVYPDGTQHGVVDDVLVEYVQPGVRWTADDIRGLMERRYSFLAGDGGDVDGELLSVEDAQGAPATAIDKSQISHYTVRYRVRDAEGNTTTVRLRYYLVAAPPTVIPTDPPTPDPSVPVIIPDPNRPGAGGGQGKPLDPVTVTVDPKTGLVHAVVEDSVTLPTAADPVTPAQMAALIGSYYQALSDWGDGTVTAGDVRLFDAAGNEVEAIDRTVPGSWVAERLFTDGAGNTTLMRLFVTVAGNSANGSMPGGDNGGGSGGDGAGSGSGASGGSGGFGTALRKLPQTGGLFGPCPLHVLFVLMALVASSYSLMRLRRGRRACPERRAALAGGYGEWGASAGFGAAASACGGDGAAFGKGRGNVPAPFRYTALDGVVHSVIFCCTVCLGLQHLCPYDWAFALVVIAVEAFWLWLMLRRARRDGRREEARA